MEIVKANVNSPFTIPMEIVTLNGWTWLLEADVVETGKACPVDILTIVLQCISMHILQVWYSDCNHHHTIFCDQVGCEKNSQDYGLLLKLHLLEGGGVLKKIWAPKKVQKNLKTNFFFQTS